MIKGYQKPNPLDIMNMAPPEKNVKRNKIKLNLTQPDPQKYGHMNDAGIELAAGLGAAISKSLKQTSKKTVPQIALYQKMIEGMKKQNPLDIMNMPRPNKKIHKKMVRLDLKHPDPEKYGKMNDASVNLAMKLAIEVFNNPLYTEERKETEKSKEPKLKKQRTKVNLSLTKPNADKYGEMGVTKTDMDLAAKLAGALKDQFDQGASPQQKTSTTTNKNKVALKLTKPDPSKYGAMPGTDLLKVEEVKSSPLCSRMRFRLPSIQLDDIDNKKFAESFKLN